MAGRVSSQLDLWYTKDLLKELVQVHLSLHQRGIVHYCINCSRVRKSLASRVSLWPLATNRIIGDGFIQQRVGIRSNRDIVFYRSSQMRGHCQYWTGHSAVASAILEGQMYYKTPTFPLANYYRVLSVGARYAVGECGGPAVCEMWYGRGDYQPYAL
ncbi:unnamed protein product [Microthlaspi erraticum]|uniref:Uncharacterized protein n=1 Tax=Microthlaspi erraticum TaxID=1685480 RepID=A0A6D2KZ41_9BRAS|nr:unnamed protein product [Microthlaspi erraticum]